MWDPCRGAGEAGPPLTLVVGFSSKFPVFLRGAGIQEDSSKRLFERPSQAARTI